MRMYNGCPGPELQKVLDAEAAAQRRMGRLDPNARCTYFPMEATFSVWSNYKQIASDCSSRLQALEEAIRVLEKKGGEKLSQTGH